MAKHEFYQANQHYYLKTFYYTYQRPIKWFVWLFLPFLLVVFFLINFFIAPESNFVLKLAVIVVLIAIFYISVIIWKRGYIARYSFLKHMEEYPEVLKISWARSLKFSVQVFAILCVSAFILYILVSAILYGTLGIPFFK